ncbi:unnamed protein product [Periconia digitata]|uniref:Uncharacterized protein n=1 Tax=Periconia digitata TaxID=1303443 RepID=A0A9W4UT82_9PLEO|nr:unnamed protein product [Periconia digitata]
MLILKTDASAMFLNLVSSELHLIKFPLCHRLLEFSTNVTAILATPGFSLSLSDCHCPWVGSFTSHSFFFQFRVSFVSKTNCGTWLQRPV